MLFLEENRKKFNGYLIFKQEIIQQIEFKNKVY